MQAHGSEDGGAELDSDPSVSATQIILLHFDRGESAKTRVPLPQGPPPGQTASWLGPTHSISLSVSVPQYPHW